VTVGSRRSIVSYDIPSIVGGVWENLDLGLAVMREGLKNGFSMVSEFLGWGFEEFELGGNLLLKCM